MNREIGGGLVNGVMVSWTAGLVARKLFAAIRVFVSTSQRRQLLVVPRPPQVGLARLL